MAIGFPAHSFESRVYHYQQHELIMVTRSALDDLGWQYEPLSNCVFLARVPVNFMSWGEKLKVEISPDGSVAAESKCSYPLQAFDWGKNAENIKVFFSKFESFMKFELENPK